jgi:hypothetical protein
MRLPMCGKGGLPLAVEDLAIGANGVIAAKAEVTSDSLSL